MPKFLIVNLALTGSRRVIRKRDIEAIQEDHVRVNGDLQKCVKIELSEGNWIKVTNEFDYILSELRKGEKK